MAAKEVFPNIPESTREGGRGGVETTAPQLWPELSVSGGLARTQLVE